MSRTSTSKWKEVLGFDESSNHIRSRSTSTSTSSSTSSTTPYTTQLYHPAPPTYPRLPRDITFTRTRNSDILLSPSSPAPSPNDIKPLPAPPHLFYITIQRESYPSYEGAERTGRPDLILHSGPSKANTVLSYAKFHPVTTSTEITLCPPIPKAVSANFSTLDFNFGFASSHSSSNPDTNSNPHSRSNSTSTSTSTSTTSSTSTKTREWNSKFQTITLKPSSPSLFTVEKHSFTHTFHQTQTSTLPPTTERFEWRYSHTHSYTHSPFHHPKDQSGGLKLVRCKTGEVVAVYAGLGEGEEDRRRNPRGVVGMMRFLPAAREGDLEGDWEVVAVVSILCVVERGRRARAGGWDGEC